ncbi:hypothetical protein EG329_007536 [Mollisiaceae sp. DMI_Dod_QoI]|nr:hypothetical protein EG329_007536 [Helotiales sp. DMI_Dod_QoI]
MATSTDNSRLFKPENLKSGPLSVMKYYPASGLTFTKTQAKSTISTTIIVGVDGACPNNGKSPDQASWGIYFGRNSRYNTCGRVPESQKKTNNVAEIYAAISAVKLVSQSVLFGPRDVEELVIMSDSDLLVKSLSTYIWDWKKSGFRTSRNKPVLNSELIKELDELIDEVEMTLGLRVRFWHVRRKHNFGADRLANIALDEDADWDYFWHNQLEGEPKTALTHLLALSASALEIMGPRLLCLEYPLTEKGQWNSSLRMFLIVQAIRKIKLVHQNDESRSNLMRIIFDAILGPNGWSRANLGLEKYMGKFHTQMSLLNHAVKKFRDSGDASSRELIVTSEVSNHLIMTIVSKSLKLQLSIAEQNSYYSILVESFLSGDTKRNFRKRFQSLISGEGKKSRRKGRKSSKPKELAGDAKVERHEN